MNIWKFECVHVLPKTGSKVCVPAIADAVKKTAPPPMIPPPLMIPKRVTAKRTDQKFWTFQFVDSNHLPPGQSDLQVEKACTRKKGLHSRSGLSSRNSQSSRERGSHPAAIAASISMQYLLVSAIASSSKWLMSVPGYFVVIFLTGHRQTGATKSDVSSNAQFSYRLSL